MKLRPHSDYALLTFGYPTRRLPVLIEDIRGDHSHDYEHTRWHHRLTSNPRPAMNLVFGCVYWWIASEQCSTATLRRRRDEWIEAGAVEARQELALEYYDHFADLEPADVAVDGCTAQTSGAGRSNCGGSRAAILAAWDLAMQDAGYGLPRISLLETV